MDQMTLDWTHVQVVIARAGTRRDGLIFTEEVLERMANNRKHRNLRYDKERKELLWSGLVYGLKDYEDDMCSISCRSQGE
jgi:hypothetical protein